MLWPVGPVWAQVTEEPLKAAFVYNFATFATWAHDDTAPGGLLTLCTSTTDRLHAALVELAGRAVHERVIEVRPLGGGRDAAGCDLLVVDAIDLVDAEAPDGPVPRGAVENAPQVDAEWWIRAGMMTIINGEAHVTPPPRAAITLVREGGRMRFDVDATTARGLGIEFSSRLLALARRVW